MRDGLKEMSVGNIENYCFMLIKSSVLVMLFSWYSAGPPCRKPSVWSPRSHNSEYSGCGG